MLGKLHIGILLLLAVNTFAMSRYPESQKVRKPTVAGSFYPSSAREIKSMLAPWIHIRPSGDSVYGDKERVVGYNSIVFTRREKPAKDTTDHLFNFSLEEKKAMIATARQAICSALRLDYDGDARPVGILKEKGYGVFVTLHLDGRLRGCIGRFTSDDTLSGTIREMAESAAFHDPRFPALSRNEVHRIDIEVSVLSPLKKMDSIDEFKLGRDGIYIIKGRHHGTFLPQVAEETGWSTEEFLGHCARDIAHSLGLKTIHLGNI